MFLVANPSTICPFHDRVNDAGMFTNVLDMFIQLLVRDAAWWAIMPVKDIPDYRMDRDKDFFIRLLSVHLED